MVGWRDVGVMCGQVCERQLDSGQADIKVSLAPLFNLGGVAGSLHSGGAKFLLN